MHSRFRTKGALSAALIALAIALVLPSVADALPKPGAKPRGFRLFARSGSVLGALTGNRVYCGLATDGRVCVDSTNSSTIGGGFWPKGTPDQYVFNSGLQLAGIIGADGASWAGDTVGAFFFDPKGTTEHGEPVNVNVGANNVIQGLYNSSRQDDLDVWPDAACVPNGDVTANFFDAALQTDPGNVTNPSCRKFASQQDVWFLSWEGNGALNAGRKHPLGIMVETRGMTWNFPVGNEDILYFIYTFYNITSTNANDYIAVRPSIRPVLQERAQKFHDIALARFGFNVPAGGYTIDNLFAAFSADMDVAEAGANYSSVNLPFALGYVYTHDFEGAAGWSFDPSIFKAPFFPGAGFVGVKYLASPTGAGVINLFSNTINQGAFDDAQNTIQLYRYLSGSINTAAGDASCTYNPVQDHICFVNTSAPDDMRFFQSSTALSLAPGGFGSIVVAYVFAAPVGPKPVCGNPNNCIIPGNPTLLSNPTVMANGTGASTVDTISGFRDWNDLNGDGVVEQNEFTVVNGSLLQKSIFAQTLFDAKFLLPAAPASPNFFLIPGSNQVTVLWQPSATETGAGDPFFQVASSPLRGGIANPFYDPGYVQNDVEGYRVYRGRVDAPNELSLLAQFDYAGTSIPDFTGTINADGDCAPEFQLTTSCPGLVANPKDGTALTAFNSIPLVGNVIQVRPGPSRVLQVDSIGGSGYRAVIINPDTAVTGGGPNGPCGPKSVCPGLGDTGVPFVFIDQTPRNNFRYFYSVTAFDVNSFQSGNSSLESSRATKATTPVGAASNSTSSGSVASALRGRGLNLDSIGLPAPTIDPVKGTFSGPAQPANGANLDFVGQFVTPLFSAPGVITAELKDLTLGDARNGVLATYSFFTTGSNGDTATIVLPIQQELTAATAPAIFAPDAAVTSAPFAVATADPKLSANFQLPPGLKLSGVIGIKIPAYQVTDAWGRGCFDGAINAPGATPADAGVCLYNGPRWFDGANETQADPTGGNDGGVVAASNAGTVAGINTIQTNHSFLNGSNNWRQMEAAQGAAIRAADMKVYWSTTAGLVDSVIDVTHNVVVPFQADNLGGGWGILNQAATTGAGSLDGRPTVLTMADFGCIEPALSGPASSGFGGSIPCTAGVPYQLANNIVPGVVAFVAGDPTVTQTATAALNPGFGMWIAGHTFLFELSGAALPVKPAVWTLRSYIGAIFGGNGAGGNLGPYSFQPATRTFSALGATLEISYQAVNHVASATTSDLKRVHTVPDPYYVTSEFEQTTDTKFIKFVNLPATAIVRIYSSSGVLVNVLENPGTSCQNFDNLFPGAADNPVGGECAWNVRNRNNQVVASGVYFYHIESGSARRVGRFTVVNFAQ